MEETNKIKVTTRQIMLDTETTGLEYKQGHRVLEIGAVEVINREITGNNYHQYTNPEFKIDKDAMDVHGITPEFLADKPKFGRIANEFLDYIRGAELVIHNAPFDVGFLNNELELCGIETRLEDVCTVIDSLEYARNKHPGARNSLDALCKRYGINNEHRTLHGALLDSEILAELFLIMTGGQTKLGFGANDGSSNQNEIQFNLDDLPPLKVQYASVKEITEHQEMLNKLSNNGEKPFIYQIQQENSENDLENH